MAGTHQEQLYDFINFLNDNNYRYVAIRGFLKLPVTADTDLDIVIHPEDFSKVIDGMKIVPIGVNAIYKETIVNECIYEPSKTVGNYDKSMSNGCFRIDLYNRFFFHMGLFKFEIPGHITDIFFEHNDFLVPNTNIKLKIPKPEVEITLLLVRAIIDRNGAPLQNKHLSRIDHLYEQGLNEKLLISLINMCAVYDNGGFFIRFLNNNYLDRSKIKNILMKRCEMEHSKEDTILKTDKISLDDLVCYQPMTTINEHTNYVPVKACYEYQYLRYNKNKPWFWTNYSKNRYDNLIKNVDFTKNMEPIKICQDYRTNYRYVWYSPYDMKYIPYIYKNGTIYKLGLFDSPMIAARRYDSEAKRYHNYTACLNFNDKNNKNNKNEFKDRQNGSFQIRDGIHRSSISTYLDLKTYPVEYCYNLGKRPKDEYLPLEKEYHSFLLWKYDDEKSKDLEASIKDNLENTKGIIINYELVFSISDRYLFVNNVYKRERQFYGFSDIPVTDQRIQQKSELKIVIFTDHYPLYFDNIKQGKNLPINKKITDIKKEIRKNYDCFFFHCSDNTAEHDSVISSILADNDNSKNETIKYYLNTSL